MGRYTRSNRANGTMSLNRPNRRGQPFRGTRNLQKTSTSSLSTQLSNVNSVPQKETITSSLVSRLASPFSRGYQIMMAASGGSNSSTQNTENSTPESSKPARQTHVIELSPMAKRKFSDAPMNQSKFRKLNRNLRVASRETSPEPGSNPKIIPAVVNKQVNELKEENKENVNPNEQKEIDNIRKTVEQTKISSTYELHNHGLYTIGRSIIDGLPKDLIIKNLINGFSVDELKKAYTSYVTFAVENELDIGEFSVRDLEGKSKYQMLQEIVDSVSKYKDGLNMNKWWIKIDLSTNLEILK